MMFDKKKLAIIISKGPEGMGKKKGYSHDGSHEMDGEDDKYSHYSNDGMEMAMSDFINAVKNDDEKSASKAMVSWCKIYKSYDENNMESENSEEYRA